MLRFNYCGSDHCGILRALLVSSVLQSCFAFPILPLKNRVSADFHNVPSFMRHSTKTIATKIAPLYSHDGNGDDNGNGNRNDDSVFFNDFDGTIGDASIESSALPSNDNDSHASVLQSRVDQLKASEQQLEQQISQNWKEGHWSVRGCALDRGDFEFGESGIQISSMLSLNDGINDDINNENDENTILVGRTDGSICWLQVGSSEYMATFTNRLAATQGDDDTTISIHEKLQRDEQSSVPLPRDDPVTPQRTSQQDAPSSKFEILAQLQNPTSDPIVKMATVGGSTLFVLTKSKFDPIHQYSIHHDGPISTQGQSLQGMRPNSISILPIRDKWLISVGLYGEIDIWDVPSSSLLTSQDILLDGDDYILSCDVEEKGGGDSTSTFIYVGTAHGFVHVYALDQILDGYIDAPMKSISAFENGGVSSICAAGEGTMGQGRPTPTLALITGSTTGEIKQWELLPRGTQSVEYWPKMARQTMPGKSHILAGATIHASTIQMLCQVQNGVVLSATNEQLVIWDGLSGKSIYCMDGMDFQYGACCLLLSSHLLVTNGMKQYVCVHDFSIDPDLQIKDMLAPMDDGDE